MRLNDHGYRWSSSSPFVTSQEPAEGLLAGPIGYFYGRRSMQTFNEPQITPIYWPHSRGPTASLTRSRSSDGLNRTRLAALCRHCRSDSIGGNMASIEPVI